MSHGEDHDASAAIQWKRNLELDRPCGAVDSNETCWLCDDFPAWNTVIYALDLVLAETAPGTLRLSFDPNTQEKEDLVTAAREASIVLTSLLRHHLCIQEVYLECAISSCTPAAQPSYPVFMCRQSPSPASRRLRLLRITESYSLAYRFAPENAGAHLDLRDMGAIIGLETLDINIRRFSQCFAAELDALLERNCNTLKSVEIFEARPALTKLRMVEHLAALKFLTLKSLYPSDTATPDVDGMVSLLRGSTTLKEATVWPILPRQVFLIAKALRTNCCLTKLSLHLKTRDSTEALFRALEVNKHLKELFLQSSAYIDLDRSCVRAVASAFENNNCIRTFSMKGLNLPDGEMGLWSKTLSKNCTLERLSMHCRDIPMREVSALCKALRVNKSLKTLKLSQVEGSEEERTSLARQLLEDECYDRVRLGPWTEPYLRVLAPVLASSEACISELWLPDICQLSLETVSVVYKCLASNKVNRLTVAVFNEPDYRVSHLCETLKNNRSIQSLRIQMSNGNSANEILRALSENTAITELSMRLWVPALEETMTALSNMLSRNKAITSIYVDLDSESTRRYLEAIAQGISGNRLIISLGYCVPVGTYFPLGVFAPVRRNRAALNRAMDFALERREDRHCAECFELFFGRSCLITNLMEIGKMSDVEARIGVTSAENRRREKYLVLTGVVWSSVACGPTDVTQIDALNSDCWRAIARYLKVTDVRSQ